MGVFDGKVALVTGGSTGIGRETARAFAKEGAAVVLTGRRSAEGWAAAAEIQSAGGKALFLQADMAREADVERSVQAAVDKFGRLDFAFNNAGIEGVKFAPITEQTEANFRAVFDTNVLGVLWCLKHQLAVLTKSGGGAIVNNASISGLIGFAGMSVYVASKHAVLGLTKSAALEACQQGVRVNAVAPGVIESEMFDRFAAMGSSKEAMGEIHPMGRIGTPAEIASAVLWLCSPGASFVTGVTLPIDGGYVAQ